ncbi:hypothetical protein [Methylibium sp.]|uniref:hypothetical protein n=1 Tax=Methylibium sp. TaxID=2067992 RepID=UPI003D09AA70
MIGFVLRLIPWWAWALILSGLAAWGGVTIWTTATKVERQRWQSATLDRERQTRDTERELQRFNQGAQNAKDAEYRRIAARLSAALHELRSRPDRLPEAARAACEGSTGAELSGRDAAVLEGLAARADQLRAELAACQDREWQAYDALSR